MSVAPENLSERDSDEEDHGEIEGDEYSSCFSVNTHGSTSEKRSQSLWMAKMTQKLKVIAIEAEAALATVMRSGDEREKKLEKVKAARVDALETLQLATKWKMCDAQLVQELDRVGITDSNEFKKFWNFALATTDLVKLSKELCQVEDSDQLMAEMRRRIELDQEWTEVMGSSDPQTWMDNIRMLKDELACKERELQSLRKAIDERNNGPKVNSESRMLTSKGTTFPSFGNLTEREKNMFSLMNEQKSSGAGMHQRSDLGTVSSESRMIEMLLKAQLSSNLGECTASNLDTFEAYMRIFESRYEFLTDEERKDQLILMLKGNMRRIFERLPRDVRQGEYCILVDHLKGELRGDIRLNHQRACEKLRILVADEGELTEYCDELERLTAVVYEDVSPAVLSRMRASELWSQIRKGPMGPALVDTYETVDPEELYQVLRTKALRIERQLPHMRNPKVHPRVNIGKYSNPSHLQHRVERGLLPEQVVRSAEKEEPVPRNDGPIRCFECRELGHYASQCPRLNLRDTELMTCYLCKEVGHKAIDCPGRNHRGSHTAERHVQSVCVAKGHRDLTSKPLTRLIRDLPVQQMHVDSVFTKVNTICVDDFSPEGNDQAVDGDCRFRPKRFTSDTVFCPSQSSKDNTSLSGKHCREQDLILKGIDVPLLSLNCSPFETSSDRKVQSGDGDGRFIPKRYTASETSRNPTSTYSGAHSCESNLLLEGNVSQGMLNSSHSIHRVRSTERLSHRDLQRKGARLMFNSKFRHNDHGSGVEPDPSWRRGCDKYPPLQSLPKS